MAAAPPPERDTGRAPGAGPRPGAPRRRAPPAPAPAPGDPRDLLPGDDAPVQLARPLDHARLPAPVPHARGRADSRSTGSHSSFGARGTRDGPLRPSCSDGSGSTQRRRARTDRARVRGALALADLLEHVTAILAGYDRAIAERRAHPTPASSRPAGRGPVTVATLIAEIGEDWSRFPSPGSLLAEAGLAPVTRQSGSSRRVVFRYAANHHLRAIWHQWMLTAIRISPWTGPRTTPHEPEARATTARSGRSAPLGTDPLALLAGPSRLRPGARPAGRLGSLSRGG